MTLNALIVACGWEPALVPDPEVEVSGAYVSDLLSDVMAHCPDGAVLITVQNTPTRWRSVRWWARQPLCSYTTGRFRKRCKPRPRVKVSRCCGRRTTSSMQP